MLLTGARQAAAFERPCGGQKCGQRGQVTNSAGSSANCQGVVDSPASRVRGRLTLDELAIKVISLSLWVTGDWLPPGVIGDIPMNANSDNTNSSRTGMRRVFPPWEYRHLWCSVSSCAYWRRWHGLCRLWHPYALVRWPGDGTTYGWAALFLGGAALGIRGPTYWERRLALIACSASPRTRTCAAGNRWRFSAARAWGSGSGSGSPPSGPLGSVEAPGSVVGSKDRPA